MPTTKSPAPLKSHFPASYDLEETERRGLSTIARGLVGSEILRIAADIRAMQADGKSICNLTVGDFSSTEFRIPTALETAIGKAYAAGQTNYPPSDGIAELRREVLRFYERELSLSYPIESVLIAGGSRPLIYATYRAILEPGEKVLYPVPSWNNNHYVHLSGATGVELVTGPERGFLPTADAIAPLLPGVRLLCINTPLNPTGTVLRKSDVREIAQLVVDENRRRAKSGERSLYLMWDQVYWMLTFGKARHVTPPEMVPESAAWTIFVDGISKAFAATGLRVGWGIAPPYVTARMRDILGHVGAWAPRPEQVATAQFLSDADGVSAWRMKIIEQVKARLDLLHDGFQSMAHAGLPIDSLPPQGAIYLSARFDLIGRSFAGKEIRTNEDIRRLLLDEAGFALVPFQAFGLNAENGWMRLSVGAVSPSDITAGLARIRSLLGRIG